MKRIVILIVVIVLLFTANYNIIQEITQSDEVANQTNIGVINTKAIELLMASSFAIIESIIIFVLKGMLEKRGNTSVPVLTISANRISGTRKNDSERRLPKVKLNSKTNEFIYVYAKLTNNSTVNITSYTVCNSEVVSTSLLPGNATDFVMCIYLIKGHIKRHHFLLHTQYTDSENNIFKGLDLFVINKQNTKASICRIVKPRKCRLCIK